jgi:anaerobic carbon-monoxide dehydrogenase iron sulfur subunit
VRGTIVVDHEKCVACKRCVLGCTIEHSGSKELFEAILEGRPSRSCITVNPVKEVAVPTACHHCEAAVCVVACPTGALFRQGTREPVVLDHDLCVGCRNCIVVCPFGVPKMRADGTQVYKCDLCIERIERDEVPACVESCRTGTLTFRVAEKTEKDLEKVPAWAQVPTFDD